VEDNYRHKGLRQNLVKLLQQKGIKDNKVLSAILNIPRHFFLDKAFEEWAYKDVAFPIDNNQTISQPFTVARQTELLRIHKGDKILEIGTGSGFQACVLSYLGAKVYSIERQESLFQKTYALLRKIGYGNIRTLYGDGYKGSPRFAPFDKIIVTAGASELPKALMYQLRIGGLMVIPVGTTDDKKMLRIKRVSEDQFTQEKFGAFKFVPFLEGTKNKI